MQALQAIAAIENVENPTRRRRQKVYQKRFDPFSLPDIEFKRRYRFSKDTARFIINLVRQDLQLDSRGCGTSPELQVLTAIRCWGRREVQEDGGDLHGLSQPTVSRICARVARAIARHSATYIKMPQTLIEQQTVIREFQEIRNFPSVLGCIDCTHIKIKKYGGDAAQYYINRKGFYSMNVQVTCDAKLRIRDIVARWRGSTHDSRIFNESTLKERFERGDFKGRLLGDSGYRLERYLFTPILRPQNAREENYNRAQIATRNCVERCFGVWKQRFQSLLYGVTVHMHNVKPTIVALAVLHNIAIDQQDPVPENDGNVHIVQEDDSAAHSNEAGRGRMGNSAFLRAFIDQHFS
ncbi:putative nuclease HARBI1 [Maniola jurtina]|uniref:putative nuclease HARBI1 n=2 Tax=Maniola jurtina TaxID=191418 RepID=UPI001E68C478|nr:putative nuclease HARBI1 [Maniola jurtina]XP_045761033.1 putative nuclease HARBI1 [Maniola jurtina]XP_045766435.1 putative nuclease HARBI1 [Maniola jurtina]XP_045772231.1 putative nuclease HARBI1 [Maniola jurtina]XP_045775899.1 putative nuclease HARBI1 [Maniola jurtina]XP_045775900.1 putative nuclease HARBI1 [Maniola jurtina]XP_045780719.1 putative nuclease HARBI1 [Maniola jurtina]XP_045781692.1 putative nuclease HARBI1 [Maniola jurtina]